MKNEPQDTPLASLLSAIEYLRSNYLAEQGYFWPTLDACHILEVARYKVRMERENGV
jgi:hypothetical protein